MQFIIIVDDYDYVIRKRQLSIEDTKYLLSWIKDFIEYKSYLALSFITGVLPSFSFYSYCTFDLCKDYSMLEAGKVAPFFGYTEDEVKDLCVKYKRDFNELKRWDEGYFMPDQNLTIYNHDAINRAIDYDSCRPFWSETASFSRLTNVVDKDIEDLDVALLELMLGRELPCHSKRLEYLTDGSDYVKDCKHTAKEEVFTLLLHYSYLSVTQEISDNGYMIRIANYNHMHFFFGLLEHSKMYAKLNPIVEEKKKRGILLSRALLLHKDAKALSAIFTKNHSIVATNFKFKGQNKGKNAFIVSIFLSFYHTRYNPKVKVIEKDDSAYLLYRSYNTKEFHSTLIKAVFDKDVNQALLDLKERECQDYLKDLQGKILLVCVNYNKLSKECECLLEEIELKDKISKT